MRTAPTIWMALLIVLNATVSATSSAQTIEDVQRNFAATKARFTSIQATLLTHATRTSDANTTTGLPKNSEWNSTANWAVTRDKITMRGSIGVGIGQPQPAHPKTSCYIKNGEVVTSVIEDLSNKDEPQVITITRSKKGTMNPLDCGYTLQGTWYVDVLAANKFTIVGTEKNDNFGQLTVLEGTLSDGNKAKLFVAPEFGNIVVRSELLWNAGKDQSTFVVREVIQRNGICVPVSSVHIWTRVGAAAAAPVEIREWILKDISVGNVKDSVFQLPKLLPWATIKNDMEGTFSVVELNGKHTIIGY
ncbi:MAG: hypothetical protein ABJA67_07955, partial [Chthonomonadales bacterium]